MYHASGRVYIFQNRCKLFPKLFSCGKCSEEPAPIISGITCVSSSMQVFDQCKYYKTSLRLGNKEGIIYPDIFLAQPRVISSRFQMKRL